MRIFKPAILIAFFLLVPELYAQTNNRVVAYVNDDVITLYMLNSKIEEFTGKTSEELQSEDEQKFFDLRSNVLDTMILDKLAKEKIKELELMPTEDQIDNNMENIKQRYKLTQEELVAELKKEGITYEKYREKIADDIGRRTLIETEVVDKLIISEEQIREYYEEHKKDYIKPGKAHIASIFLVPTASGMEDQRDELEAKGKDILARLQKGEAFADLARKFSNGPGAEEGGDLGDITLADVDPKILEIINSLKEGEVSTLVDMGNRYQIIKLIKKTETEWVPLEEVRGTINDIIYNNEIEKRYEEYMMELKNSSYTKIIL